jgi:hypothetical protein
MNPVTENKRIDTQYYVEGYATTFKPYVLYRDYEGNDVYELIERSSLDNADMSDIIFQFDHGGMVYARTSNGSLIVEVDEHGLFVAADLGRTEAAKTFVRQYSGRNGYSDVMALHVMRNHMIEIKKCGQHVKYQKFMMFRQCRFLQMIKHLLKQGQSL